MIESKQSTVAVLRVLAVWEPHWILLWSASSLPPVRPTPEAERGPDFMLSAPLTLQARESKHKTILHANSNWKKKKYTYNNIRREIISSKKSCFQFCSKTDLCSLCIFCCVDRVCFLFSYQKKKKKLVQNKYLLDFFFFKSGPFPCVDHCCKSVPEGGGEVRDGDSGP